MSKGPLKRNFISLGLTPEVRRVLEAHIKATGNHLSPQEAVRELVLIGAGVECDQAMLLIARQQIRRRGEVYLMQKLTTFAKGLDEELRAYLTAENGISGGEG